MSQVLQAVLSADRTYAEEFGDKGNLPLPPKQDPNQQHYLLSGGLDELWVKPEPIQQPKVVAEALR